MFSRVKWRILSILFLLAYEYHLVFSLSSPMSELQRQNQIQLIETKGRNGFLYVCFFDHRF